ncbi:hypothetical protein ABZ208_27860 [Streptomyces sp. NPDC006208]|uniref:hypothetical protein n=1 Tax=Streptomyces sp. NPDC006208 TaxID=3156734 RepID=UPI0033A4EE40
MSDPHGYTLPPPNTLDQVAALIAFIRARTEPLRNEAYPDTPEWRTAQTLIDLTAVFHGSARAATEDGRSVDMIFFYLAVAARRWEDHPDYLPEWTPDL